MNDWVAIAIIFIAGMASAILLLGAGSVFRIIWPIVVDDGIGEIRFIDESYGRPELPAAAERWVAQSGIQQDGPDGVICDGMRYKWDADAWHFIGADWVNAPPWATVLLRNENTPGLVWADGTVTGSRIQWIRCKAPTLVGQEASISQPTEWTPVTWRPEGDE